MLLLRTEGDGVRSVGKIVLRLLCLFVKIVLRLRCLFEEDRIEVAVFVCEDRIEVGVFVGNVGSLSFVVARFFMSQGSSGPIAIDVNAKIQIMMLVEQKMRVLLQVTVSMMGSTAGRKAVHVSLQTRQVNGE